VTAFVRGQPHTPAGRLAVLNFDLAEIDLPGLMPDMMIWTRLHDFFDRRVSKFTVAMPVRVVMTIFLPSGVNGFRLK